MKGKINYSWTFFVLFLGFSFLVMPGENRELLKKIGREGIQNKLPNGDYFIYSFSEKPKIGTTIVVIKFFNRDNFQITGYDVQGRSDMPSMGGAHNSGWKKFIVNKMNNYLLPVDIVMRGEWEIRLKIQKDNLEMLQGYINFEI